MRPPRDGVHVRPLRPQDTRLSARAHCRHLAHGLFPRLGCRFVRQWHVDHIRSPYGIALLCLVDGRPAGFLVGSSDQVRLVEWMVRRDRSRLVLLGALALLTRPRVLAHFLHSRGGRYARRLLGRTTTRGGGAGRGEGGPVAVIEAVVVLPWARGAGAGEALVAEFCALAAGRGTRRAELVTKAGVSGAAGFYERLGWARVGEHRDRDGDRVVHFALDLPAPSAATGAVQGDHGLDRVPAEVVRGADGGARSAERDLATVAGLAELRLPAAPPIDLSPIDLTQPGRTARFTHVDDLAATDGRGGPGEGSSRCA